MALELKPWDAAEFLQTPESLSSYIEVVLDEDKDSPAMLAHAVSLAARARGSVAQLSEETGLSCDQLTRAMDQQDGSAPQILRRLLHTYRTQVPTPRVA